MQIFTFVQKRRAKSSAASGQSRLSGERAVLAVCRVLTLGWFAGSAAALNAASVNLAWNPNPESDISGYQLSYGTSSGSRPNTVNTTGTTASVSGLVDGQTYYFAVRAVNTSGQQSNSSSEISYKVPANQAPVAAAKSVTTTENKAVAILLSASDPNGDALTYSIVSNPTMGKLSGTAPNLTYTPNAGVNGADSFTFRANDGKAYSNTATVSITVTAANDAPVATGQSVTTAEDKAVGILLAASDMDGDKLTYGVVTAPAKGKLSGSAPNLTYTPNADANGADSFTFRANDGMTNSNTATVSINITAVNDAPVATAQAVSTPEKTSLAIVLSGTDKDGDKLTYGIVSNPAKGALSGTAPTLTYIPNANATGADSFTFRAYDGKVNSNTANISVTITPANTVTPKNTPPVFKVNPLAFTAKKGRLFSTQLDAYDPDAGDLLTYAKTSGSEWLGVTANGRVSGTPPADSQSPSRFRVRATDKAGAFAEALLEITIRGANLPLPWSLADIGPVNDKADASAKYGVFTLKASGTLGNTADQGMFVWQTLSGEGEILARVSALAGASENTRVGLMMRGSLAPNAEQAFIGVNGKGNFSWLRRTATGLSAVQTGGGSGSLPDLWLRLVRTESRIIAYKSANGWTWTEIGNTRRRDLPLGDSCYIGLWLSSGSATECTAVIRDLRVRP